MQGQTGYFYRSYGENKGKAPYHVIQPKETVSRSNDSAYFVAPLVVLGSELLQLGFDGGLCETFEMVGKVGVAHEGHPIESRDSLADALAGEMLLPLRGKLDGFHLQEDTRDDIASGRTRLNL